MHFSDWIHPEQYVRRTSAAGRRYFAMQEAGCNFSFLHKTIMQEWPDEDDRKLVMWHLDFWNDDFRGRDAMRKIKQAMKENHLIKRKSKSWGGKISA
tara:strand:+ start:1503 stop:1793 length:291 start_codon:yes stop_codon:yes gene_type:complete